MSDYSIYVSSFDGYRDIWDVFFNILDYYWKNCSCKRYLVNNEAIFSHPNVDVIHTGPEKNWFDRTIRSLERIQDEYILFMLEDYFISKEINEDQIADIINTMRDNSLFCYRLTPHSLKKSKAQYQKVPTGARYPITLQPAIWKREEFLKILYQINGKTPWDFEYYFDNYDFGHAEYIDGILFDNRDILGYKNGVLRGKWFPDTVKFYKQKGININTEKRGIVPFNLLLKYKIAHSMRLLPKSCTRVIKRMLLKCKIKYV